METHSRIQELANNSEIENSRNKSHAKISEFTVCDQSEPKRCTQCQFCNRTNNIQQNLQMSLFLSVEYQNVDFSMIEDCYKGVQLSQKDIRSNTFTGVF